jgi:hypothetical protein
MLHYHAEMNGSTCDPGPDGSCLFFPSGTAVVITQPEDSSPASRLTFDPWWENLSGVNQGTPFTCVTLRARAVDGTLSDPVDVCRDDAETVNIPTSFGIMCTENGIFVPPMGTGGSGGTGGSTGTGGSSATSGSDTGGTSAGGTSAGGAQTGGMGTAGTAGAPDDDDSRTVVTEGCGCRVPAASNRASAAWLALVTTLAVIIARRRRSIPLGRA